MDTTKGSTKVQSKPERSIRNFAYYAWGVLIYHLLVILWGAYVRATGSGAGCGGHWPSCNGDMFPVIGAAKTAIEYTHRVSVAIGIGMVVSLVPGAFRYFPAGHRVRMAALSVIFFTFTEALVGAGLVLFGLVEHDASIMRAIAMAIHLINTFLLLGALTCTAWWASGGEPAKLRGQGAVGWAIGFALLGTLLLSVSGAVTALGDTLYPSHSLLQGLRQDISPTAHFLIRLRFLHPLIAMSVGLYLLLMAGLISFLRPTEAVQKYVRLLGIGVLAQIAAGFINMGLLAPIWMQLVHLLLADFVWIALLLVTAGALSTGAPQVEMEGFSSGEQASPHAGEGTATYHDYIVLTKPRVISLLLFTTLAAMFIAEGGWPGGWLFFWVTLGGYAAAGAANAINMVIDRDIDGRMLRTAARPTVTRVISSRSALSFAFALEIFSFAALWAAANLLAAMLALAGLAFYVLVYTLALKRRTWHNIVIGGAAGAFPPLVGWAAVTGSLNPLAWCLFAIIFVWTPVHFWALALMIKDDYAAAGIPMLPVVLGERVTVLMISLYAVLTALISAIPLFQREVGGIYMVASFMLNAMLLLRCFQLYKVPERPQAMSLYKYSMLYLALLFLIMAIDRRMSYVPPVVHKMVIPAGQAISNAEIKSLGTFSQTQRIPIND